jgi:hypothetical protein
MARLGAMSRSTGVKEREKKSLNFVFFLSSLLHLVRSGLESWPSLSLYQHYVFSMLSPLFYLTDVDCMFLQNTGKLLSDYTVSHPRIL